MLGLENVSKTQLLIYISIAKAFILSGKLRVRGNLPLEQILDEIIQSGETADESFKTLITAIGKADNCGLDFDLEDADIIDMIGKNELPPISELPACTITTTIGYKTTVKKNSGELSVVFNISLAETKDVPAISFAFTLSGENLQNVIPILKNQFLHQNRITELVNQIALSALIKASGQKKVKNGNARSVEVLLYKSMVNSLEKKISQETKETVWLYAEQSLAGFNALITKKVIHFSVSGRIQISDKITLSLDFAKKTKKR